MNPPAIVFISLTVAHSARQVTPLVLVAARQTLYIYIYIDRHTGTEADKAGRQAVR